MQSLFSVGDLAESTAGRDKGKIYLLIKVEENTAYCVNGRDRKIDNPKKKKIRHLERVSTARLSEFAERIQKGESVGNEKLFRSIKAQTQKKQED